MLYFQGIWLEILGIVRGTSSSAMLGLMESPLHHFFDDRTDEATLDALMRGRLVRRSAQKLRSRHHPGDKLLTFREDL